MKITSKNFSNDQVPTSNYRNMLLLWARRQCQDYPGIYIEDFTSSWRNGRAFLAILHRHKLVSTYKRFVFYHFCTSAHNHSI